MENPLIQGMASDIVLSMLLSIGFGLTALYVTITRRHKSTWKIGVVVLVACTLITLAYTLRGVSADLSARVFWYKMSLVGFSISTSSFFCLALQYTKSKSGLRPRILLLLSVFPLLTTVLILTNEFHGLLWDPTITSQLVEKTLFPSANEAGIWYWIFIAYSFFIMGLGCIILIQWIIQSRGFYSQQALGVVVAATLALLGSALDVFRVSPFQPFVATATGLAMGTISVAYALIPLRRHDVLSVSRGAIINNIDDCIIVVDSDERIALVNPVAEQLMGYPQSFVVSKPLKQFLPTLRPISTYNSNQNREAILQIGSKPHTFSLRVSSINDWRGKSTSHVIVLRDITEYKQAEDKLLSSESNLAEAQRISHLGSWEWNLKTNRVYCSEEMFRIAGLLPLEGEITLDKFNSFLHPDEAKKVIQAIQQNSGYPTTNIEHLILRPNGETRNVHSRIRAYRDEFGRPLRLLGSVQDITERKQAEAQIHLQAAALASTVNGIMITDSEGNILWANPSFVRMTGYSIDEFNTRSMSLFDYGSKDPNVIREIRESIRNNKSWAGEMVNVRNDGTEYFVDLTITPVIGQKGEITHYVSISQDISEKVEAKKQLEYLATHDALTSLPNRLLFKDRLSHALTMAKRTGQQGAIFFIDLDNFKSVNDVFSHTVGDELLILLAKRIRDCLRASDTVARIGGDEFAILLEDIDQFKVDIVAQKVLKSLSEPAKLEDNTIIITASIGISFFSQDGDTIPVLMKNADLAMYQAKEHNKNTFEFYNHEMASKIEGQMDLLNYLRFALMNDIFELFFQPQVNCQSGDVVGAEALLRLPHPKREWVPPSEFIPLAERTDIILLLDEWVIQTACRKKRELLDSGIPDFNLSLNISNRQLGQANLINMLKDAIQVNNLNPDFLELEINESSAFQNVDVTIKTMNDLKALGIKLAIDNFGKGYSSLSYLANFPLDVLKIDLSFTQRIPDSQNHVGIVKGIIAIAKSLGIAVIVEGVENKEQLKFFMNNGIKFVQGNYYCPAIPGNELAKILRTGFRPSSQPHPKNKRISN
jgi:diguanylate cyclase (GGDEF)-like protein/PAS domain S-box-containing protein